MTVASDTVWIKLLYATAAHKEEHFQVSRQKKGEKVSLSSKAKMGLGA